MTWPRKAIRPTSVVGVIVASEDKFIDRVLMPAGIELKPQHVDQMRMRILPDVVIVFVR